MIRKSSNGNPWHTDSGKFCSISEASIMSCFGVYYDVSEYNVNDKKKFYRKYINISDKSINDVSNNFYVNQSFSRNEYDTNISKHVIDNPFNKNDSLKIRNNKISVLRNKFSKEINKFNKNNKWFIDNNYLFPIHYKFGNKCLCYDIIPINKDLINKLFYSSNGIKLSFNDFDNITDGFVIDLNIEPLYVNNLLQDHKKISLIKDFCENNKKVIKKNSFLKVVWDENNNFYVFLSEYYKDKKEALVYGRKYNSESIYNPVIKKEILIIK